MKILVCQPIHETGTVQLEKQLRQNPGVDVVLFPEGYLANEGLIQRASALAQRHAVSIITGYRDRSSKDRALIVSQSGEVMLDRAKTPMDGKLLGPSVVEYKGTKIGYLLCVELLQGFEGFAELGVRDLDFVAHPIGVGMFSEAQFDEWVAEAKRIAVEYKTMVIGTSHADGSFRNCGTSIPIAYCIGSDGEAIFLSKNDLSPVMVDTVIKSTTPLKGPNSTT